MPVDAEKDDLYFPVCGQCHGRCEPYDGGLICTKCLCPYRTPNRAIHYNWPTDMTTEQALGRLIKMNGVLYVLKAEEG